MGWDYLLIQNVGNNALLEREPTKVRTQEYQSKSSYI